MRNILDLRINPNAHLFPSASLNYGGVCLASDAQFSDFLGSMGPAQFVGRQTLATTPMGECSKPCAPPSLPLPDGFML